mgnify:CR=1 FL=1
MRHGHHLLMARDLPKSRGVCYAGADGIDCDALGGQLQGKLADVDGEQTIEEVNRELLGLVESMA